MTESVRGSSRILAKLKKLVESKSFYEAHQMYRTLYSRYMINKKYEEALGLVGDGAFTLLLNNQQSSGADLGLLYLEVFEIAKLKPTEEDMRKISRIFAMMDNSIPERHQFLVRAIRCSIDDSCKMGHPFLHKSLAEVWWEEQNYSSACYHYLRSNDGSGCAGMLIELQLLKGYPSEVDLFVVQPVLQYLCLEKTTEASDMFQTYTNNHPKIQHKNGPSYLLPLLNFLWLLLVAIKNRKVNEFTVICEQYQQSLKRDPLYNEYLDKIGQLFFDIPAPQTRQPAGIFGNFFEGLLGSLSDDSPLEQASAPELD